MDLDLLRQELGRDEGVEREPYLDTQDNWTTGIGYNLNANPLPEDITYPLTDDEIERLFELSVQRAVDALNAYYPWWTTLDEVRQRVLVNMCFNLGIKGLQKFVKFLHCLEQKDFINAALEMQSSLWYKQVGERAVRLCQAMRTGIMP